MPSSRDDIKVAIIGMGAMGKGLFHQCHVTPGVECVAIADIDPGKCLPDDESLCFEYRIARNVGQVHQAIQDGLVAVCEDGTLPARCDMVDVLIESSNSIGPAARIATTALEHRKHLILMNAEVDLIFGPYLMRLAKDHGVVYTSCDGDQHGVLKHLIDDMLLWGFELVMAGNMKGFLDRYSNPTKIVPEADKRRLDYKMATAYTDGTKLCIEMALIGNCLGLSTLVPGMHGPRAKHVKEALTLFDLDEHWSHRGPFVDYVIGAEPDGGVFAIGYCNNMYQERMLAYYKMGDGPYYLFYRPYHLCHIEAMGCVIEAARDQRALLQPTFGFLTNVYAYAKRPLSKGAQLDGIGGYSCYGLIENCDQNAQSPGLPICLADNVTLKRDVTQDEKILMSDISHDSNSFEFCLYKKAQEQT